MGRKTVSELEAILRRVLADSGTQHRLTKAEADIRTLARIVEFLLPSLPQQRRDWWRVGRGRARGPA